MTGFSKDEAVSKSRKLVNLLLEVLRLLKTERSYIVKSLLRLYLVCSEVISVILQNMYY